MNITEFVASLTPVKELVDWDVFSEEQKWVIYSIVEDKLTWRSISTTWAAIKHEPISFEAIGTCLLRSAMSRPWKKGENQGNVTYLCEKDLSALDNEIRERAYISKALDTVTVTDEAAKLK